EQLSVVELDSVVDDLAHSVARRAERPPNPEQVVAQAAQTATDVLRAVYRNPILQLVDLVVQRVDDVEEALGYLVDQVIGEHTDLFMQPARFLRRLWIEWLLAGRRLRNRQE